MALILYVQTWLFTHVAARLGGRLRRRYFEAVLLQEGAYFETHKTGAITSRLSADATLVAGSLVHMSSMVKSIGSGIAGMVYAMAIFSWCVALEMRSPMTAEPLPHNEVASDSGNWRL